jgi:hypothetical protein
VLVQNAFAAAAAALQNLQNATGFKNQFTSMVQQLKDRAAESQDNVKLAEEDVKIANAQEQIFDDQIRSTRNQIDKLQHQSFDLGNFLTTTGGIANSVISIGSGLGAITSIPAAIVAIDKIDRSFGILDVLRGEYEFRKDGDPKKDFDKAMSKVGSGLTAFMKLEGNVSGFLANLNAFEKELDGAGTKAEQSPAQLMKELVNLQKQQLVAKLRQAQARDRVSAAQRQVQNLTNKVQTAQGFLSSWAETEVFLTQAVDFFIAAARHLVDIVAEDVFIARRALEIYQLDRADDLRFDYGYLHPDQDHSLTPLARVTQSQNSVSALAPSILTWNDLFNRLNVAQAAGFQVVHPAISFSITDPALLAKLSMGGLQFSIDSSAMLPSVFELKVNSMQLTLEGASASKLAIIWIEHSGHWRMASRKGGQVEFSLFPHIEAFNCDPATGKLMAKIPAQPPSAAEPGPPFSFWGRGVVADWKIFPDASSVGLDFSKVTALNLTVQCIAFAPIAINQPVTIKPVVGSRQIRSTSRGHSCFLAAKVARPSCSLRRVKILTLRRSS